MQLPAGRVLVVGSELVDSIGEPANGTIFFQPVGANGQAISYKAYGGGQVTSVPVSTIVSNGAFRLLLHDTTLTNPVNIGYKVRVSQRVTGNMLLGPGYEFVQPHSISNSAGDWCSNGVCNFDQYIPNTSPNLPVTVTGPQGATGPPGLPGTGGGVATVASSSQPVFDGSIGLLIQLTLGQDVVQPKTQNFTPGEVYTLEIMQPVDGVFDFVWPASLLNPQPIAKLPGWISTYSVVCQPDGTLRGIGAITYHPGT